MASSAWIIPDEPIHFLSPIVEKDQQRALPSTTRLHLPQATATPRPLTTREPHRVAPVVASTAEPIDLCTDDEEDCDAEIEGKGNPEKTNAFFPTILSPLNVGAPSPPLSSEAPSPASTRDFGGSETWSRGSTEALVEWEDVDEGHDHCSGSAYNETDDDTDGELDEDKEGEAEPHVYEVGNDAFYTQLPRPIIPLPARAQVAQAPSPAPSPIAGPSKLSPADAADSDNEHDDYLESEEDDDGDYAAPAPKRRRNNSGKPTAVASKRATKRKGKGKACEPKRRLVNPPESIQAAIDGAPAAHAPAPDVDPKAPKWVQVAENLYCCLFDDCAETTKSVSGISRHVKKHLNEPAMECPAGCGVLFPSRRREVLKRHMEGEKGRAAACKASLAKRNERLERLKATARKSRAKHV
ncbi:hypothetical protein B0H13DRAFT_1953877 [Mycena leptocephala]|nr:hypothetical protein B0H13DRAFT_1953877 [Mycena leptocephala]